jgi:SAM-dependent methyltransferase
MTLRSSCICGGNLIQQSFSQYFDALHCDQCDSKHFIARAGSTAPEFKYDSHNGKYAQQNYLYGKQLRWAHHELLSRKWAARKVLEIGCFNGFFLDELRTAGANVYGFDINQAALAVGESLFGLQGRLHSSFDALRALSPFDDLLCVDVLEHVDAPEAFLADVKTMLCPGGRIMIAGPTLERRFHDKTDYPPHHKWWFSRLGLRMLLQRSGYEVSEVLVQRDGVLLLRNFVGKIIHGLGRREYYGDAFFAASASDGLIVSSVSKMATPVMQWLFGILSLSYCSTMIIASRKTAK